MNKKNILFYFNLQMNIPFYGLIMQELDKLISSDEFNVYLLSCDGDLYNCFNNRNTNRLICHYCKIIRTIGESSYRGKVNFIRLGSLIDPQIIFTSRYEYSSIEDIKKIVYKGCFIGYGALSSYISYTRNLEPVINNAFRSYFDELLLSETKLIEALETLTKQISFFECYIFNGRWADSRPVFDLCKTKGINLNVLEQVNNGVVSLYKELYPNVLPHDIEYRNSLINRIWAMSTKDLDVKENISKEFFLKRRNSDFVRGDYFVFTANQDSYKLPENWKPARRNIAVFNSSEDEFVALGNEWEKFQLFGNQEEGLITLLEMFKEDPQFHFYLRIHPNLRTIKYGYHTRLLSLETRFNNITVIPGDSNVSTYKLIDNCEKIIVFGSTVGVESCFWRKPVILLGGSFYYYLNVAYIPNTKSELKDLIEKHLPEKPLLGAYKYGFYVMNYEQYTEKVLNEPYPIKILGLRIGYGFEYMKILKSPLLFKIINKIMNFLIFNILVKINRKRIPDIGN